MIKKSTFIIAIVVLAISCDTKSQVDPPIVVEEKPEQPCEIINPDHKDIQTLDLATAQMELETVYDNFENFIKDKNNAGLKSILFHPFIPLFITGKETTGITTITMNGPQFENYIIHPNQSHELRITNDDFSIYNGVAVSWANYVEVINGNIVGDGIDLFFYINTPIGWKIATTNNTYLLPNDTKDYGSLFPMTESPNKVLDDMVSSFNQADKETFLSNFKSRAPLIFTSTIFKEIYTNTTHSPTGLMDCINNSKSTYQLDLSNTQVDIRDTYLAEIISDYTITNEVDGVEKGKLIMTMIGTPLGGWKISAVGFSYKE